MAQETIAKGYVAERYGSDDDYKERKKEIARRWYRANKERAAQAKREERAEYSEAQMQARKEYMRAYNLLNKEELAAKRREYHSSDRGIIKRRKWRTSDRGRVLSMLRSARQRAKLREIEFSLTAEDIVIPATCPILGIPLTTAVGRPTNNSPSLDRIDPSKGYTEDNVQVISYLANTMKSNATAEQLVSFAKWVNERYQNAN